LTESPPTINVASLDAATTTRILDVGNDVVLLPINVDDEVGIYPQSSVFSAKDLRQAGIDAAFLDPSANRRFVLQQSADVLLTLAIGVASNAVWAGLSRYLRTMGASRMRLRVFRFRSPDGGSLQGWEVEGESEAVLDALDRLLEEDSE